MRAGDLNALDWTAFGAQFSTCKVPRRRTGRPHVLDVPEAVRPFVEAWWNAHEPPTTGPKGRDVNVPELQWTRGGSNS